MLDVVCNPVYRCSTTMHRFISPGSSPSAAEPGGGAGGSGAAASAAAATPGGSAEQQQQPAAPAAHSADDVLSGKVLAKIIAIQMNMLVVLVQAAVICARCRFRLGSFGTVVVSL